MPLAPLREREKRILLTIRLWQWSRGYSPSVKDIADAWGVGKETIATIFASLKKKGYIKMSPHKNWQHRVVLFPIKCGFPWEDEEYPEELFGHLRKEKPPEAEAALRPITL